MFALLKNRDKCHKKTAVLLLPPRLRLRQSSRCFRALTPRGIRLKAQPEITSMNRIPPRTDHGDLSFHTFKGRYNGRQLAVF